MPRALARIRRRFNEGTSEVLDRSLEEQLVFGMDRILGASFNELHRRDDWQRAWDRWGDILLPKSLKARPGLRPVALYAIGTIAPRELEQPLPIGSAWEFIDVAHSGGTVVRHYLNVPPPYLKSEADHLRSLGEVSAAEHARHLLWCAQRNSECDTCLVDDYVLECDLHGRV